MQLNALKVVRGTLRCWNSDNYWLITYLWGNIYSSSLENFSDSSSSEESEYSSDFDSSDSFASESSEESSCSDLSTEDEGMEEEGHEDDNSRECIVLSSDDESMELERPVTPIAPLTPGAELELCMQDWSGTCQQDTCDLDIIMELQTSEPQDRLRLLSPLGLPGCVGQQTIYSTAQIMTDVR